MNVSKVGAPPPFSRATAMIFSHPDQISPADDGEPPRFSGPLRTQLKAISALPEQAAANQA